MNRPAGIETEYGLNCEGFAAPPDFPYEAAMLIRSAPAEGAFRGWDYEREDPYRDLRGSRAASLARDAHDLRGPTPLSDRMSRDEVLADTVLQNGARLYNDHNHPEYCTDVCATLRDLVAQDRAGERILVAAERRRNASMTEGRIRLLKNNTDYHGRSYGCHENYLTSRAVDLKALVGAMVPFLVTRQVFAGAGRVGVEGGDRLAFQLSQRADFFEEVIGINTTARRPIFNTRDEPHADRRKYRRLHVITGDANRSEWATAMKVGTAALVIDLAETGWRAPLRLADPPRAMRRVSHAADLRAVVELTDGRRLSAVDVQDVYREAAERWRGRDPETNWVLDEWARALDDARHGGDALSDRVDWAAKRSLMRESERSLGRDWDAGLALRIDFAYHVLDPDSSLYAVLEADGRMRRIVSDADIEAAVTCAPAGTRAEVRSRLLQKFRSGITAIEWDHVTFRRNGYDVSLRLDELHGPTVDSLGALVDQATDLDDLVAALSARGGN